MNQYKIVATSTFGLESIVAQELKELGYDDLIVDNGKISFSGDLKDIARCNLNLRTADRVFIELTNFEATDFDLLFEAVKSVRWEDIIPQNAKINVTGKSVKSKLHGVPTCQAMTKKAIIESMKRKYKADWFKEDGPEYRVEISLYNDTATLYMDTSGAGLHRRGYRTEAGEAPLRENLAAAMIILSRWDPSRILADPLCGSGTIAIEAALMGKNIAPGLKRSFASEKWSDFPKSVWEEERKLARSKINNDEFRILGSDVDSRVLTAARENIKRAGVEELVALQKLPVKEFRSRKKYGCIVCNPPYGERTGDKKEVEDLYKTMGETFASLDSWSIFVLTAHEAFERLYGKKSTKNRKLYNGNIRCYLYEYFGPLPAKETANSLPAEAPDEL